MFSKIIVCKTLIVKIMITFLLACTVFSADLLPAEVTATTLATHYTQPWITDISGHFTAEGASPIPFNTATNFVYGMGSTSFSQSISWTVQDFTAFGVPTPFQNYQRGINSGYGSTAGQIYGNGMGFMVNKFSTGNPDPVGDLMGMQFIHAWDNLNLKPWNGYGSDAKLRIQVNYGTSGTYRTGATVQYGQLFVNLVDTSSSDNHNIWFVVNLWDSRGVQAESVARDTGIPTNFVINTHLTSGMSYCSRPDWSNQTNGTTYKVFYCAYISRQNLINAITALNSAFSENMSTNPDHYAVNVLGCGPEMYSPDGSNGWIAALEDGCGLYTEY
ncbi:MAG: hypothetical protein ACYC5K_05860 [Saccharofermentanales bacterium]